MWNRYCHHVYLQHHNSLKDLRKLDLSQNNLEIHAKAKTLYTRHFENSSGSMLELILASARFDLNAVLIQYMDVEKEFYVFDICPQNRKKAVFLNVGPSHNGKWRYVEHKGKIPVGNYSLVLALPEKTVLTIRKKVGDFLSDQAKIPEFDLKLFNRLLSRAARLEEFTFALRNISSNIPAWADDIEEHTDAENTPQDSEFLLLPQKTPPPSSYAFKSLETLQDCSDWCKNLTKNPEPKRIIGADVGPISNLPLFQKMTFPRLNSEVNPDIITSRKPPFNSQGLLPSITGRSLEFKSIDADGKISVRILQNDDFGSPQILLRFEARAQLTQEAQHELFLRPLHFPIEFCLFESENSTFNAPKFLTSEFRIPGGSIFSLKNPNDCPASIRCAWFT
ncbi:unnamed protein product [Allacma fusca]|uniref:Uncharacterized protein n=1 Tax=Allacma fusca TaxID=39272 RepID=A0A8J2LT26_9HEXA|nr:unnamed protein product [Allacma fusca]